MFRKCTDFKHINLQDNYSLNFNLEGNLYKTSAQQGRRLSQAAYLEMPGIHFKINMIPHTR